MDNKNDGIHAKRKNNQNIIEAKIHLVFIYIIGTSKK